VVETRGRDPGANRLGAETGGRGPGAIQGQRSEPMITVRPNL